MQMDEKLTLNVLRIMFHGVMGLVPSSFLVECLSTKSVTWVQKIMIGQILMFKNSDFFITFFWSEFTNFLS
jgi:hypothetical protein